MSFVSKEKIKSKKRKVKQSPIKSLAKRKVRDIILTESSASQDLIISEDRELKRTSPQLSEISNKLECDSSEEKIKSKKRKVKQSPIKSLAKRKVQDIILTESSTSQDLIISEDRKLKRTSPRLSEISNKLECDSSEEKIKSKKRKVKQSPIKSLAKRKVQDIILTESSTSQDLIISEDRKLKRTSPQLSEISNKLECDTSNSLLCERNNSKQIGEINETASNCIEQIDLLDPDIPLDVIKLILKHCTSQDVSEDICQILADHCSDKLRKIITSSLHYMNHCGRKKFTADDFNKGLYFCGEESYMHCELSAVPEERQTNAKEIDITKHQNHLECQAINVSKGWLNNDNPLSKDVSSLPDELQNYFDDVTKVLLFEQEEVCCVVLNDFKTNKCIFNLVPYFVTFLCDTIEKLNSDCFRVSILLKSMETLLSNPYLYFGQDTYLNRLVYALLKFLLAPLPYMNPMKDCWLLKDTAANILAFILKISNSKKLFFEVIDDIDSVLSNFKSSIVSQYGALVALNSIGVPAILLLMPSCIDKYYKHVSSMYYNYHERNSVCMILGQIIHSHYLLVHHYFTYEFNRSFDFNLQHRLHSKFYLPDFLKNNKVFPVLSQSSFTEYFGDTLVQHFPSLNFVSYYMHLRKKKIKTVKKRKFYLKNSGGRKGSITKNVHKSINQIFDIVPLKNRKINFGKIGIVINES